MVSKVLFRAHKKKISSEHTQKSSLQSNVFIKNIFLNEQTNKTQNDKKNRDKIETCVLRDIQKYKRHSIKYTNQKSN